VTNLPSDYPTAKRQITYPPPNQHPVTVGLKPTLERIANTLERIAEAVTRKDTPT
jgi:hypothetical protein